MLTGTMSSHTGRLVLDGALQLGVSPGELTHLPGLEPTAEPSDTTRIPTPTGVRLWELIARRHGPGAGVMVADFATVGCLSVWDLLITTGPTLAEGFRAAAEYLPAIADPLVGLDVVEDGRLLSMTYRNERFIPEVDRALDEFVMALVLKRARDVKGPGLNPVRVDFAHPAPRCHRQIADALGTANLVFDADSTTITFLDADAPAPRPPESAPLQGPAAANTEVVRILRRYADLMLQSAGPAPSWQESFRATLATSLEDDDAALDRVAVRLGMSSRTLQRRLGDLGTTWREEMELARHGQAVRLLRDTDLPLRTIAARLGYADARTLARAFVRWTGRTPAAFRSEVPDGL
jgi:AraC-like DNA-binding protein